jgi:glycerol-3-phosphate dehydrogenase
MTSTPSTTVAIIGGGIVGTALAFTLAHRGVPTTLLEADSGLAYAATGTNSGILHTGFDSTPGELETELILRAGRIRPAVIQTLGIPFSPVGAVLVPHHDSDHETIARLAAGAAANQVDVEIRASDGALIVPGESITDPVAFALRLARSAQAAGATILTEAKVAGIEDAQDGLVLALADGRRLRADVVINAAGLMADDIARLVGDTSFEIYPRKGEFFVFELPGGATLEHILLPVPTKRTKGILVFPTLDGRVLAGPTAVDLTDKNDWNVRPEASREILSKAIAQLPALDGLKPVASYAGLRPAGRDVNYLIGPSAAAGRLINVAAIRSTGLTASLGIADYVAELLPALGVRLGEPKAPTPVRGVANEAGPWWRRTAGHVRVS